MLLASLAAAPGARAAIEPMPGDLVDLSLEQLSEVQVTSVSKIPESLLGAPASVFVITRDDIRMAGVTSLPEALRLAPGVEVARSGAHSWAISIRGFNSDITNKLLVLIDGRSVYSPLYAGVFWDVQDVLLEDVDRIEVVSGPGGTLWGANAVNGVVNIITRSARDTRGGFLELGAGNQETGEAGLRYGSAFGTDGALRIYFKTFDRDASQRAGGASANDAWRMSQGGFRADWASSPTDRFTVQGDLYRGEEDGLFRGDFTLGTLPGPSFPGHSTLAGGNLLGRWSRQDDAGAGIRLQAYLDHTVRNIPNTFDETRDTFDLDFQRHAPVRGRHDVLWGLGLRLTRDAINNSQFAAFLPDHRSDRTLSAFVQDKIDLGGGRWFLTVGSKFEHNDYTGFESQPNLRLSWLASDRQSVWMAASRAVRIPSRLDADLRLTAPVSIPGLPIPIYVQVNGNHDFEAEHLTAYEAGYRAQVRDNLSLDVALFVNQYNKLQTTEPRLPQVVIQPPIIYLVLPNDLANNMAGTARGGSVAVQWSPITNWRLQFQYSHLDLQLHTLAGSQDVSATRAVGNSPANQAAVHSFLSLPHNLSLYVGWRHVGALPAKAVAAYNAVDLSLAWAATDKLSLALTGNNLGNCRHAEFDAAGNVVERSVDARLTYRF